MCDMKKHANIFKEWVTQDELLIGGSEGLKNVRKTGKEILKQQAKEKQYGQLKGLCQSERSWIKKINHVTNISKHCSTQKHEQYEENYDRCECCTQCKSLPILKN